jgi:hypothetical protein
MLLLVLFLLFLFVFMFVDQVNGRLGMSRSIGDMELKPFGVIAEPHIRSLSVSRSTDISVTLCGKIFTSELDYLFLDLTPIVARQKMHNGKHNFFKWVGIII